MEKLVRQTDFELSLVLKNLLMVREKEDLIRVFSGVDNYITFICTVVWIINNEPAFLYISDSYLEKIEDVMLLYRFNITEEFKNRLPGIEDTINEITTALNEIKTADLKDRKDTLLNYIEWQKSVRNFKNASIKDILDSISDDTVIYFHLMGKIDASSKKEYPMKDRIILASLNYLLEVFPGFFMTPGVCEKTEELLKMISKNTNIFDIECKKSSKETKQKLKSLFIEE